MKTKTDNHINTVLRSVMERRAERIPALSDDFAQQVMSKMNARKESVKSKRTASFFILHSSLFTRRFAAGFSIAAALFIAFILWSESNNDTMTQQEVKPVVAETNPQSVLQPIDEEKKDEVLAEARTIPQPVRKHRKAVRKQQMEPAEVIIPIETVEDQAITMEPTFNSYADIEAEMLNIRSRGERVEAMVADLTRSF